MLRVGMIGILVTFLSMLFKKEKNEYGLFIGVAAGILIFALVLTKVADIINFVSELVDMLPVDDTYLFLLLKMLGITYIGEFASSLCKDAGYGATAMQIELFAKISILALSIPGISYILDLLDRFMA